MKNMVVSFIIPCYNCQDSITQTLESIIQQENCPGYEIILVNDGSTDGTSDVIENYMGKHSDVSIMLLEQENAGPGTARNIGLDHASGTYILFVDADDVLEKNYASLLVAGVEGYDFCFGAYYRVVDNDLSSKCVVKSTFTSDKAGELFSNFLGLKAYVSLWNSVFIKDIIIDNDIRFMDRCYCGEDVLFVENYLICCKKVNYVAEPIYTYYYGSCRSKRRSEEKKYITDIKQSIYWTIYEKAREKKMGKVVYAFEHGEFPLIAAGNLLLIAKKSHTYLEFKDKLQMANSLMFNLQNASLSNLRFHIWLKLLAVSFLVRNFPYIFYVLARKAGIH